MSTLLWLLAHAGAFLAEFFDVLLIVIGLVLVLVSYAVKIGGVASLIAGPAALLSGPLGTVARYVGLMLIVAGGCRLYVVREMAAYESAFAARQAQVVAQAEADAFKRGSESVAVEARDQAARERSTQQVKTVIIHAGPNVACRDTPAFRAAADELRYRAGAGGGKDAAPR